MADESHAGIEGDLLNSSRSGSGGRRRGDGGDAQDDNSRLDYGALGDSFYQSMGIATSLSQSVFDRKLAAVQSATRANTVTERKQLELALVYYFSAHGTSPETQWATYDKPFVFAGRNIPPLDIVKHIGENQLKQFMARFSEHVPRFYAQSERFRSVLAERAARIGMDPDQGAFVVDFYGKDGSLDHASLVLKAEAKNRALRHRAANIVGVGTQQRADDAKQRIDEPAVVPVGLGKSFKAPPAR